MQFIYREVIIFTLRNSKYSVIVLHFLVQLSLIMKPIIINLYILLKRCTFRMLTKINHQRWIQYVNITNNEKNLDYT